MQVNVLVTEFLSLATNKETGQKKSIKSVLNDHLTYIFGGHYHSVSKLQLIVSLNVVLNKIVSLDFIDLPLDVDRKKIISLINSIIRCVDDHAFFNANELLLRKVIEEL